jgi:hypothetical protein
VKGKIVLCEGSIASGEAIRVGAVGVLMQGHTHMDIAYSYPLSASYLHTKDARKVHKYIRSTRYISSENSIHINSDLESHIDLKLIKLTYNDLQHSNGNHIKDK